MGIYRRVLEIPWTEQITNEEVLRRMGTCRKKCSTIQDEEVTLSRISYISHFTPQLQLIEGNIEGIISRGRPRTNWIADLTNSNGAKYYQLKRAAEYRKIYHGLVVNIAQEATLR